jgi:hypothetical protein
LTEPSIDPELLESIEQLEANQKRYQRRYRRSLLFTTIAIGVVFVFDTVFVLTSPIGGPPWLRARDVVMVGGIAIMGLNACYGALQAFNVLIERDRALAESYRVRSQMEAAIKRFQPVAAAIREAHERGVPIVFPPPDEAPPPDKPLLN